MSPNECIYLNEGVPKVPIGILIHIIRANSPQLRTSGQCICWMNDMTWMAIVVVVVMVEKPAEEMGKSSFNCWHNPKLAFFRPLTNQKNLFCTQMLHPVTEKI